MPQGSVLGPILLNFYINDLFLFIEEATLYNYADDNTLAFFSKTLSYLSGVLKEETGVALNWLKENQMIANPEKNHAILIKKDQTNLSEENLNFKGEQIKSEETVRLLGLDLDHKLNFEKHISEICRKAASQLNVLKRLKRFVAFNGKKILLHGFIYSNFDYCPLLWYFSSVHSLQKIERIQERALRFLYNDQLSSYGGLLSKSGRCTLHVFRIKLLCIEIFKSLNKLNPFFMRDIIIVKSSSYVLREANNL